MTGMGLAGIDDAFELLVREDCRRTGCGAADVAGKKGAAARPAAMGGRLHELGRMRAWRRRYGSPAARSPS